MHCFQKLPEKDWWKKKDFLEALKINHSHIGIKNGNTYEKN